jgi:hypothetical protein
MIPGLGLPEPPNGATRMDRDFEPTPVPRFEAILLLAVTVVSSLAATLAMAYAVSTASFRIYEGVEAELAFEASRLRAHLALYTDPLAGAFDYGEVPARFYALYTPVWSSFLALLPLGATKLGARLVATSAWIGSLALGALAAPVTRRRTAWTFATFAAGCFFLVRGATSGTADALATLVATVALLRITKRGSPSPSDMVLLALAPLLKPNVIGILVGVSLGLVLALSRNPGHRRRAALALGAAVLTVSIGVLGFELLSGGTWLHHLVLSSAQEWRFGRWVEQVGPRVVLLGAPHLVILALALRRGKASPYATLALLASTGWALVGMAKSGSATNYWLEPTAAALVVLATTRGVDFERPAARVCAGFAALNVAISAPALLAMNEEARKTASALPRLREACSLAAGEMLFSHDVGIEVELTGRLTTPPFQASYLLRHGRFPLATWEADLALPRVRYFVARGSYFEAPTPSDEEGQKERLAYLVELRPEFERLFVFDQEVGPFRIYRRR